mmetsp:Transcript_16122/g.22631  ORF Transcript_16122/g.22631 Transcript_16122/m.22631 type:complete len:108 (-) Transcript_16122:553-876(-)
MSQSMINARCCSIRSRPMLYQQLAPVTIIDHCITADVPTQLFNDAIRHQLLALNCFWRSISAGSPVALLYTFDLEIDHNCIPSKCTVTVKGDNILIHFYNQSSIAVH